MLVVDLVCEAGHRFEGWFGSSDDLASQQARGLLTCPVCNSAQVQRLPSATHINRGVSRQVDRGATGKPGAPSPERSASGTAPAVAGRGATGPLPTEVVDLDEAAARAHEALKAIQKTWLEAARQVIENTDDVGDRFADEARKIHYGDAPERGIRGQASAQEREALKDEGIEVVTLPLPKVSKDTLQ
jgi:hypothetical protein